jgi:hypothetical protein
MPSRRELRIMIYTEIDENRFTAEPNFDGARAFWAYQDACEQARRDKTFTVLKATRHFWRSLLGLPKIRGNSKLMPAGPWFGIKYK